MKILEGVMWVVLLIFSWIVDGVVHHIVDDLWGFVSPDFGRLWQLVYRKEPEPAPVLLDQGRVIQSVMDLFHNAKAVRLRSYRNKYLSANEDKVSITQAEDRFSENVCWTVEFSSKSENKIRLKSCYGTYLTASSMRFILGFTGSKVLQMSGCLDSSVVWQLIQHGNRVSLKSQAGKFLRANGNNSPYRDSVTHDIPWVGQDLILWDVDVVEQLPQPKLDVQLESLKSRSSWGSNHQHVSHSFVRQENSAENYFDSSKSVKSPNIRVPSNKNSAENYFDSFKSVKSPNIRVPSNKIPSVIELFHNAKAVRLRSYHNKYLFATEDGESVTQVTQDDTDFSKNVSWTVEFSSESENKIRLKSCYGKYLTASNERFLIGMTGRKVLQTDCLDSSVEWQLIQKGNRVKLMTRDEKFIRANDSIPPWRNSVTHGVPIRAAKNDWLLWDVEVVEFVSEQSLRSGPSVLLESSESNHRHMSSNFERQESNDPMSSSASS